MVRFKTRWLLLAIDDKPVSSHSPFASALDDSEHASTSAAILSAARAASSASNTGVGKSLAPQLITRLLRASLAYNFGDVAAGAFGGVLTCKYYSSHTGIAIVRCSRDAARLVWASATMVSSPVEMGDVPPPGAAAMLRIRVLHCGGTIKKLQNKAIELDRKLILRLRNKQRKLAAASTAQAAVKNGVITVAITSGEADVPVAVSIPAIDDDEDLGEALESNIPTDQAATLVESSSKKGNNASKSSPKLDPETQALLARSRKEINSIGS